MVFFCSYSVNSNMYFIVYTLAMHSYLLLRPHQRHEDGADDLLGRPALRGDQSGRWVNLCVVGSNWIDCARYGIFLHLSIEVETFSRVFIVLTRGILRFWPHCIILHLAQPLAGYSTAFKAITVIALLLIVLLLFLYSASLWVLLANNNLLRPL